uniref:Secreted protein n=1 Tax=Anisakis simplex TaxID=6269 RepID=A0A0M3JI29_ANISI
LWLASVSDGSKAESNGRGAGTSGRVDRFRIRAKKRNANFIPMGSRFTRRVSQLIINSVILILFKFSSHNCCFVQVFVKFVSSEICDSMIFAIRYLMCKCFTIRTR